MKIIISQPQYRLLLKEQTDTEKFRQSMRDTVSDQSASYPQAEKEKNVDMWLNMWARDFIQDFTKNEIGRQADFIGGSNSYCNSNMLYTYPNYGRKMGGEYSLIKRLEFFSKNNVNEKDERKLWLCQNPLTFSQQKWDMKFPAESWEGADENGKIGWWKLLNLDWGTTDKNRLKKAWDSAFNKNISTYGGAICNMTSSGEKCYVMKSYKERTTPDYKGFTHNFLTVMGIASAFVPFIGPFMSAGFGLLDAYVYYKDGDEKTAGLVALFSLIPGLGVASKIVGVSKMGQKGLIQLARKVSTGAPLSKLEQEVFDAILKNSDEVISQSDDLIKQMAQKGARTTTNQELKTTFENLAETGLEAAKETGLGAAEVVAYDVAYDELRGNTPKAKAAKEGLDWAFVKNSFGSSGSGDDNTKLNKAWDSGWRPGKIVPKDYQTKLYATQYKKEVENLNKLKNFLSYRSEESLTPPKNID